MKHKSLIIIAAAFIFFGLTIFAFLLPDKSENKTQAQSNGENANQCNKAVAGNKNKTAQENVKYCDFSQYKTLRVQSLKINSLPKPPYPPEAKDKNIEGCVPVRVLITKNGDVSKVCLIDPEERFKGCPDQIEDELFETLATEAALKAKFDVTESSTGTRDYFEMPIIYTFLPSSEDK